MIKMPGNTANQSVQRAVRVLYAVAGSDDGRTINQIAQATGLRLHTAYKFIRTLEEEKLLHRRLHPLRFLMGPALAELKRLDDDRHLLTLGGRVLVRSQVRQPAASLVLLEADGIDTYQRLGVFAERPGVLIKRRDFKVPPYAKASSLLFLAYAPAETAEEFFKRYPFDRDGKAIWKTREALNGFLSDIRRLGYALPPFPDKGMASLPLFRLAVPVFAPDENLVATVAGYIPETATVAAKKHLVRLCREAGLEITEGLRAKTVKTVSR